MSPGKTSSKPETPAGTANSIQGVSVLGFAHGEAAAHPTLIWVTR
jgi:hypothetical protein